MDGGLYNLFFKRRYFYLEVVNIYNLKLNYIFNIFKIFIMYYLKVCMFIEIVEIRIDKGKFFVIVRKIIKCKIVFIYSYF